MKIVSTITTRRGACKGLFPALRIFFWGACGHATDIKNCLMAYDADRLYDLILDQGGEPVIPKQSHRRYQNSYDRVIYKNRWGVEGFFAKLKWRRRIATGSRQARCKLPWIHQNRKYHAMDQ